MTSITYDQRCDCPRPHPSGRVIFSREVCRLCERFIITSSDERGSLEKAELEAERTESKQYEGKVPPALTTEQVADIVHSFLQTKPDLSNTELRRMVSSFGTFSQDINYFGRLVRGVRDELGIVTERGRARA